MSSVAGPGGPGGRDAKERRVTRMVQLPAEGVLRVATSQLEPLDPARSPWCGGLLSKNVYGGLVAHGADGRLIPWLATSYTASDDTTEWAFTLRPGVRFHDGAELDATAVKRSFE